ncbi:hypothetical protein LJR245_007493 [Rhizobium leguminosarum]|uniref:hypothetical protein n=1 Tax=Rhizobium leguminosarum TaxID=384 RepID=UPI003ECE8419
MDWKKLMQCAAIKALRIVAKPAYAPMSAWEFEFLKTEGVVQDRLRDASIYIVAQRPLIWFDNVVIGKDYLSFEITDGGSKRIFCRPDLGVILGLKVGEIVDVQCDFQWDAGKELQPFKHVAGIRIYKDDELLVWWSPLKLMFEAARGMPMPSRGDIDAFWDFDVHYIGRAFSQPIWERLTGHDSLQSVVTRERPRGSGYTLPAYEICLITLQIVGFDEYMGVVEWPADDINGKATYFAYSTEGREPDLAELEKAWLEPGDAALTTELEAMLIHMFKPAYNKIQYNEYPDIKGGALGAGYFEADVMLQDFPFNLRNWEGEYPLNDDDT